MAAPGISGIKERLERLRGIKPQEVDLADEAVWLADGILRVALGDVRPRERATLARLGRMMEDPAGKAFTTAMTDQAFRTRNPRRVADQIRFLLRRFGIPVYFSLFERAQLAAFKVASTVVPSLLTPAVIARLRSEMELVVMPGEPEPLRRRLLALEREGVRINMNHLGEAILGEREAEERIKSYVADISRPDVQCVSVKISSIYSQIRPLAWEETLEALSGRMERLYRAALAHPHVRPDGSTVPKVVTLDMEEYRDLHLTVELFQRVLSRPEMKEVHGGIVLQAYLPDAHPLQRELTAWAMERVGAGGAPIRLRIVKGANLAMERFEAAHRGWKQAPYGTKAEVDANYKRMVTWGATRARTRAVRLGIASHNLFDLCYGLALRALAGVEDAVGFEMLEGISDPTRRALLEVSGDLLIYAPMVERESVQNAIAYLIRRLDENTGPENFLRHTFHMRPGSREWTDQEARFRTSLAARDQAAEGARREHHRTNPPEPLSPGEPFRNESDTDWCSRENRNWIRRHLVDLRGRPSFVIPLRIGGEEILEGGCGQAVGFDPARPGEEIYQIALADEAQVEMALKIAVGATGTWGERTSAQRAQVLCRAAQGLRQRRGELIAVMVSDGGKTVEEADVEISEAIDFAEYYARSLTPLEGLRGVRLESRGPVVVTPPWNFPLAIPAGGVFASLMAGSPVILKPAPETPWVAWELARVLWEAGIPDDALQFLLCPDDPVGSRLISDPRLGGVILTGASATARLFLRLRPDLELHGETGGKDAMIVTAMADVDLAIQDVIQSAFGHGGQKCSAASLLICEKEVYDDPSFEARLVDCAQSLVVGSGWDAPTAIPPLVHPPEGPLLRGLTELDPGERWALEPTEDPHNPRLWTPGIRWDVAPGSVSHKTEMFGPVLSVMRAENLEDALAMVSATGYGLTSGLHSLDEREKDFWRDRVEAGNLYINRSITGAIVGRQPFGGWKASGFGAGAKAGGPNYVLQLMDVIEDGLPTDEQAPEERTQGAVAALLEGLDPGQLQRVEAGLRSQGRWWREHFSVEHDWNQIPGEDNHFRYRPLRALLLRITPGCRPDDVALVLAGAATVRTPVEVSISPDVLQEPSWAPLLADVHAREETPAACASRVGPHLDRVRIPGVVEDEVREACREHGVDVICLPVLAQGRVELLRAVREQSISHAYHRYGNLGDREDGLSRG